MTWKYAPKLAETIIGGQKMLHDGGGSPAEPVAPPMRFLERIGVGVKYIFSGQKRQLKLSLKIVAFYIGNRVY